MGDSKSRRRSKGEGYADIDEYESLCAMTPASKQAVASTGGVVPTRLGGLKEGKMMEEQIPKKLVEESDKMDRQ